MGYCKPNRCKKVINYQKVYKRYPKAEKIFIKHGSLQRIFGLCFQCYCVKNMDGVAIERN